MRKTVTLTILIFFVLSYICLFYSFDNEKNINVLMKVIYFSKSNILILVLLMFINKCTDFKQRLYFIRVKSLLISGIAFMSSLLIYEYFLVTLKNDQYIEALKSNLANLVLSIIPIAVYILSDVIFTYNDKEAGK